MGQSFAEVPLADGRRIWMGWKWLSEEGEFGPWTGGFQTIPVELSLTETDEKELRLAYNPVRELKSLRSNHLRLKNRTISNDCHLLGEREIKGELFEIMATFQLDSAQEFGIKFRMGQNSQCTVGFDTKENKIFFRDPTGKEKTSQILAPQKGIVKLHLLIDRSVIDIFGNGGLTWNCAFFKADPQNQGIEVFSQEGIVKLISFDLWQLNGIFNPINS